MDVGTRDAKPVIALAMGDPAGISPELTAKVVGLDEVSSRARLIVAGDRRVFNEGARIAGVKTNMKTVAPAPTVEPHDGEPIFVDLANLDPVSIRRGVASRQGGQFALENYRYALELARDGRVGAVCFTPFNKKAMGLARPSYGDEIAFSAEVVGLRGQRVQHPRQIVECASDIPRSTRRSPCSIDERACLARIEIDRCVHAQRRLCGPRIAVAGLNPHAGDGGNFGREEIDVIAPAVEAGKREGIFAEGSFPADIVFLRAKSGAFDAVLTMYHDQGQIAMKLMGFDRGVTLLGGFPFRSAHRRMAQLTTSQAKELLQSELHGLRCCSRLTWLCGGGDRLLPAALASGPLARRLSAGRLSNEPIGSQWPQRRGDR